MKMIYILGMLSIASSLNGQVPIQPAMAGSTPVSAIIGSQGVSYRVGQTNMLPRPFSHVATKASTPPIRLVGDQGANHRNWLKIVQTTDVRGRAVLHTNLAYVEVASGLNYKDPATGKWAPSKEEIEGYPGGAIAQYGQHKVIFANNLNTAGAIDLQMPGGQEMKSEILGLSYYDTASGKSVLIAQVKDCQGQIVHGNQVVYSDVLKGVQATVRYTYTKAGLEQDVIMLAQPPLPEAFGLSSTSSVLQVMTEFAAAPTPVIRALPGATNDVLSDEMLDFGKMKMIQGRAFLLGTNAPAAAVGKQWVTVSNRTVLVESVPFAMIKSSLSQLPPFTATILNPAAGSV